MKKNKIVKIMAILALLWILVSIVWTAILFITSSWTNKEQKQELTKEQLQKILENAKQNLANSWTTK